MASRAEKVGLYAVIRRDSRAGMSGRAIERKHRVRRRTVRRALTSAWPEPRKAIRPRGSRLDPFSAAIDQMLNADLDAPRKQRHTAVRIFSRLVAEHEMTGVSYQTVSRYVAARRPQVWAEAVRGPERAFAPQSHRPGPRPRLISGR